MKYDKPHLTYDRQLARLGDRGLSIADPATAIADLKRIGYYRLSGYLYPFRLPALSPAKRGPQRLDEFASGASFDDGVALHDFDRRLSHVLLDGLQQVEIGLRVRIGYTLGKHGALAHLSTEHLGHQAERPHPRQHDETAYQVWRHEYDRHQKKAASGKQEFVLHFVQRYEGEVPIWAAVEFMPLGCLVSLLNLLAPKDQRTIARSLLVKDQKVLLGWLRPLNVLRNHCAHANRVWNRPVVFQADKLNLDMLCRPDLLAHLHASPKAPVDHRVYFHAATLAYLLRAVNPSSSWPAEFVDMMATFPVAVTRHGLSPQTAMGFPENWDRERLWTAGSEAVLAGTTPR